MKEVRIPGAGTVSLSGIAWSDTNPVAVISGKVVGPGDVVQGFVVRRIEPESVFLEGQGSSFTIRLR